MRFAPHTLAILHVPAILAVGYVATNLPAVAYAGRASGAAEDPAVIVLSVLAGVAAGRWWQLLLATLALSVVLHFYIVSTNEFATGTFLSFAARSSALIKIAFAVNLVRQLVVFFGRRADLSQKV